ncbi:MAG: RNA polymerase sigma factor [Alphaproteobacteria bacterium]
MTDASKRALDQAMLTHRRMLVRTLARLVGSVATAEDLVHDAYMRVAAVIDDRPVHHPAPFLYRTARNLAFDHLRRQRRHGAVIDTDASGDAIAAVASPSPSPEADLDGRQRLARLDAAIAGLGERQRRVLVRARVDGWTYERIAAELGVSISTVQKDLAQALAICLAAVDDAGTE